MSDLNLILNSVLEGSGRDPSNFPWASWGVSPARFSDKSKTEWVKEISEEQGIRLNGVRHAHIPNNPANLEKIANIWASRVHEKDISYYVHHRDEFYLKKIHDALPSDIDNKLVRKLFSFATKEEDLFDLSLEAKAVFCFIFASVFGKTTVHEEHVYMLFKRYGVGYIRQPRAFVAYCDLMARDLIKTIINLNQIKNDVPSDKWSGPFTVESVLMEISIDYTFHFGTNHRTMTLDFVRVNTDTLTVPDKIALFVYNNAAVYGAYIPEDTKSEWIPHLVNKLPEHKTGWFVLDPKDDPVIVNKPTCKIVIVHNQIHLISTNNNPNRLIEL